MRFSSIALAVLATALATPLAPSLATARDLVVMSYNVRFPNPEDGPDVWEKRRAASIAAIRAAKPDVIGTQELFQRQGNDIVAQLPHYTWFGTDRRGGHSDEHMGIFYRKDRLTLLQQGQFWLSDTPSVAGSRTWGQPLPRMVTWGLFEVRRGAQRGQRFYLVNTHFPYRDSDDAARTKAAHLIENWIAGLPRALPVVLTGDFNTDPASDAHAVLSAHLADTWIEAPGLRGPKPGYHGFTDRPAEARIDWVLERGFAVTGARSETRRFKGHYPSDHYPMIARLRWPAKPEL